MATIGIATYSVKVREKRSEEYLPLGSFDGSHSMSEFICDYLRAIRDDQFVNEESQRVLRSGRHTELDDKTCGLLYSGAYGYAAEGVNIHTSERSYQRSPEDAEVIPFYYQFVLPAGKLVGIMILQRHGTHGLVTPLCTALRDEFTDKHPDHMIEFARLVPTEIVQDLIDGEVRGIQITTYTVPNDIADKFRFLGNLQQEGKFTVKYSAKRNAPFQEPEWLRNIRNNRGRIVEFPIELENIQAEVKISVKYGTKTRVMNLSDPSSIAPYIDATDDLDISIEGHPTFESINQYCDELNTRLLEQLGIADANDR